MLEREMVVHIAELARIGVPEDEIALYQKELSSVLDFFTELEKLDTQETETIQHSSGRVALPRGDMVNETTEEEKALLLANVPEKKGRAVSVRSVL